MKPRAPLPAPSFRDCSAGYVMACVLTATAAAALEAIGAPVSTPSVAVLALSFCLAFVLWLPLAFACALGVEVLRGAERVLPGYVLWGAVVLLFGWLIRLGESVELCSIVAAATICGALIERRWRGARPMVAVVTLAAVVYLNPLLAGRAMRLVFSPGQIMGIVLIGTLVLYAAISIVLSASAPSASAIPRVAGASGAFTRLFCALIAVLISRASGVFLIRLWGFSTTEYLQLALCCLEVLLILPVAGDGARRIGRSRAAFPAFLAASLAVGLLAIRAVRDERVIFQVSRNMPNSGWALSHARALSDADADLFHSLAGVSECDDADPGINPLAIDVPGDGIDQNCVGGDLASAHHGVLDARIDLVPPAPAVSEGKVAILVVIDTLRADHLDYRSGNPTTPVLAEIAGHSRVFERAYAQSNNTLESFPHMLHMGFRTLPRYHEPWMLRHALREGGIYSEGFLQAGLEHWWDPELHDALLGFDRVLKGEGAARGASSAGNAARAVAALGEVSRAPRFMFVHFEELHDSFSSIMEGVRMIDRGLNLSEIALLTNPGRMAGMMRASYGRALASVDAALAPLWEKVREIEKTHEVLLIVTSDHGEEFFEHGGFFHMGTLYEELLRVPLLIYRTGHPVSRYGEPVGSNRITPTILRFFGFEDGYVERMSLLKDEPDPAEVFAVFQPKDAPERRRIAVFQGNLKLIYDSEYGFRELFDLEEDPSELRNIAFDARATRARRWMEMLLDRTMFFLNYGDVPRSSPPSGTAPR